MVFLPNTHNKFRDGPSSDSSYENARNFAEGHQSSLWLQPSGLESSVIYVFLPKLTMASQSVQKCGMAFT